MQAQDFVLDNISDRSFSSVQEEISCNSVTKRKLLSQVPSSAIKNQPKFKMPKPFTTAKKVIQAEVDEFFKQMKERFFKSQKNNPQPFFIFQTQNIRQIARLLHSILQLKLKEGQAILKIDVPDTKQPVCVYIPEKQTIATYQNTVDKKIKYKTSLKMPDIATPIFHNKSFFLLDGADLNQQRRVYVPSKHSFQVLQNGDVLEIAQPQYQRIKCAVLRTQSDAYVFGGLITNSKIKTQTVEKYSFSNKTWQKMPSMNKPHECASACMLADKIYVFSRSGIEFYDGQWHEFVMPYGLDIPSFSFVVQTSKHEVAILGGRFGTKMCEDIYIVDLERGCVDIIHGCLTNGTTKERVSQAVVRNGKLLMVSPMYCEVSVNMAVKKGVFQAVTCWHNTSQIKQLIIM